MANHVFKSFFENLMKNEIDLDDDTIKCALLTNAYVHSNNHNAYDDISSYEVVADPVGPPPNGYTTGGNTVANIDIADGVLDADDVSWPSSYITAAYAVLYKDSGTPSTSYLIALFDLGGDKTTSGTTFTISWHANGILTFNQSA